MSTIRYFKSYSTMELRTQATCGFLLLLSLSLPGLHFCSHDTAQLEGYQNQWLPSCHTSLWTLRTTIMQQTSGELNSTNSGLWGWFPVYYEFWRQVTTWGHNSLPRNISETSPLAALSLSTSCFSRSLWAVHPAAGTFKKAAGDSIFHRHDRDASDRKSHISSCS